MAATPLAGLVVLEFAHTIMGPSCGLVLADLGADVIHVEPAPEGDRTRKLRGFAAGFFSYFNRNKRSICLDLKSPEGLAVARDLLTRADVVLENFAPGAMDRLGLGWDDVHRINPRIVYCALKGFLPGPYEHRPALDEIVQYQTGMAYMTGPPGQPLRAGSSVVDIMGGVMGVVGILAALRERDRTGKGARVTSALYESCAFMVAQHMAGEVVTGEAPPPMPIRRGAWGIYEVFRTKDNENLFIGITSDPHWERFCAHFQRPQWFADPRFTTNGDRVMNKEALRPLVAEVAAEHTVAELAAALEAASIPFSEVRRPHDLFDDPQMNANGRMLETRMLQGQMTKLPTLPLDIDGHSPTMRHQPPQAGEHTDEILRDLGYDAARIASLRASQRVS